MKVKNGEAWTTVKRFKKRFPFRSFHYEKGVDGIIRKIKEVSFLKGITTSDCPECNQSPCPHIAKLLGWKT